MSTKKAITRPVLRKWVKALRSGKYAQTRGRLRRIGAEEFCCLGVLCEVLGLKRTDDGYWSGRGVIISSLGTTAAKQLAELGLSQGPVALHLPGLDTARNLGRLALQFQCSLDGRARDALPNLGSEPRRLLTVVPAAQRWSLT